MCLDQAFKRVIFLFEEFKTISRKNIRFDEKIKRKLKLRNFKKYFKYSKILNSLKKKKEIKIFKFAELLIGYDKKKVHKSKKLSWVE